ncbi:hypothetical protein HYH03_007709 [Edaphochlamys debaryana]|uniref:N-acetyltransferase domain-containing protein n=1 Tax=Edaphochlamys debaryana TaxID=47281 RepID=A0A836BYP8_9CHLO|nr:hypothetical protein HYH03_007709 [Edaphochlamys debaryana]|eukprot:KAG2494066.1 hypothetical protein HYH03_007709 [Edaphochlamys debaryana]
MLTGHPARAGCLPASRRRHPGAATPVQPTPRTARLSTAAAPAASASAPTGVPTPLPLEVRQAALGHEMRAAAFLRAISFYKYPPGRSEFAARSHRQMKTDAEWESVQAKVQGRDPAYQEMDVTCFIAYVLDDESTISNNSNSSDYGRSAPSTSGSSPSGHGSMPNGLSGSLESPCSSFDEGQRSAAELLAELRSNLDDLVKLSPTSASEAGPGPGSEAAARSGRGAAEAAAAAGARRLVVGSLDINVGAALPSEELAGRMPQSNPRRRRAYLSNVCVAPPARRLGVARALLSHAETVARRQGVEWLYVHVVADNTPAVRLYCNAMGFQVEQEESEAYARSLQRPRRLLLAKGL